ncbi:plasmid pRiA4b ORF-3 family protein [Glutamicibacter protophormiae]|uniref:plasmid pRiA4b ORF-3 family protein n=1 Tax=Glutamicibacter protophormiae TaxID=37930 RepID=UPI002A7ED29F|nr:plasmid pRiA4b ORF-3 family protein [Glutamicibacter protophormiae]WPR65766.1 plasmid pRiA4b ORF-3 family protein [Glutamicibacter protophormiae]WPR69264.1 plasmid pRiA4b ORF-3 family protein [Glutamicibacter protophormiae]
MQPVIPLRRMLTLRIVLEGSEPAIWRTLEIDDGLMLDEAGLALQCAMGWEHAHLQAFHSAPPYERRGAADPITWYEERSRWEIGIGEPQETTTLGQALNAADGELYFEYDFGDCWMHKITVESQRAKARDEAPYRVMDGQLRAPLEDSGGIHGWQEKLSIFHGAPAPEFLDAQHIVDWMDWRGGRWNPLDPAEFRRDVANLRLDMLAAQFTGGNGLGRWFETMEPELRRALSVPAAQIGLGLDPAGGAVPPWFVELLRPFAVLIELCSEPVKLTAAGWLPPKVVGELLDRAQLAGIDYERGATQRENNMPAVIRLREAAQQMGLLRKAKGVLAATQRGRKLMDDPAALACHVAQRLARPKGEGPKGRDIESDSTFAGWMIRAGGFIPDRMQKYSRHPELFMDKSELLEMFGYWDPNQGGPVNDQSRLPALQFWYLIERLLEFRMRAAGMEAHIPQRLAELSRYLLQE